MLPLYYSDAGKAVDFTASFIARLGFNSKKCRLSKKNVLLQSKILKYLLNFSLILPLLRIFYP